MMILEHFNIPFNQAPTRGSGEQKAMRGVNLFGNGSLEQLLCVLSGNRQFSSVHMSTAVGGSTNTSLIDQQSISVELG